ncbi:MAG: hypothetical protein JNK58_06175 [Phycisphaerae bacterium]|nr:hypothetical protein [Phycisphaerae bacterium]
MNGSSPTPTNPFTLLGLPQQFSLDRAALQRAWLAGTARLHPDRPDAPPDAARQLAALNHAKSTLEDPESRANSLLLLLGGPTREQDKSLPPAFLAEILETRERMESEIAAEHDDARRRWERWAEDRRREYIARVNDLFQKTPTPETLRAIRTELNAWRYIERLIEQIEPDHRTM